MPGLSVSVAKEERLVWARGFGFADIGSSSPTTPQTSYLWFGMTKHPEWDGVLQLRMPSELAGCVIHPTA